MSVERVDTVRLATGGDPAGALAAAAQEWALDGRVYLATVAHDEGCPCVTSGGSMGSCTCEIVNVQRKRLA